VPLLTVVIPAYNAATTIGAALKSTTGAAFDVEVIVVDDGSSDGEELACAVASFPRAKLIHHASNLGMCAARNSGIQASGGDYVTILDADDRLVDGWPAQFEEILHEWPASSGVCFAACRTAEGEITADDPGFTGLLPLDDILNERHSGEYLPIFRGEYVRSRGYVDIGTRKSCGILSYIRFAQDGPFWVSDRVLRIYHAGRIGSVSSGWSDPAKALETVACYRELFRRHRDLYVSRAPHVYRTKLLRYALYLAFARRPGAWGAWWSAAHPTCLKETAATFGLLLIGPGMSTALINAAKRSGLIRRYG
jgi:glycosyltransferase involved in cell wall biosynthesis